MTNEGTSAIQWDTWNRLLDWEKDYILEEGYTEQDLAEIIDPDTVVNLLWAEYAARGMRLGEAKERCYAIIP